MDAERPSIVVVAAVVERDGRFLLTRRLAGSHLDGTWEFPGGKCEEGETHEACLAREMREELDVGVDVGDEILVVEHAYPERAVRLHFRRCRIDGTPRPLLGQQVPHARRVCEDALGPEREAVRHSGTLRDHRPAGGRRRIAPLEELQEPSHLGRADAALAHGRLEHPRAGEGAGKLAQLAQPRPGQAELLAGVVVERRAAEDLVPALALDLR